MDRRIFGIETEYGVTCTFRGQRRLSPDEVAATYSDVSSRGVVVRTSSYVTVRACTQTSAATRSTRPRECDDVIATVVRDKAGERTFEGLLVDAQRRLSEEGISGDIYLFKNNTDSAGELLRMP